MAKSKSPLATVIIVVLFLALLYALNPTTADFRAWRSSQAEREAGGSTNSLVGVMKKGAGAVAGAMTSIVAGAYQRHDYLICSGYSLGRDRWLGIAKIFIKIK